MIVPLLMNIGVLVWLDCEPMKIESGFTNRPLLVNTPAAVLPAAVMATWMSTTPLPVFMSVNDVVTLTPLTIAAPNDVLPAASNLPLLESWIVSPLTARLVAMMGPTEGEVLSSTVSPAVGAVPATPFVRKSAPLA